MDTQNDENNDQSNQVDQKANLYHLVLNCYVLITEQFAKVNIEHIMNPENDIYVLMFIPKASDLIVCKFEVHFGNQSIISKVITRPVSDNFEEEEEKKIDSDTKYSPLYIEEADNCYVVHLGKLPGKNRITFKTSFIQQITSADMSYQYIIFNRFPELKVINDYEIKYQDKDDYFNIENKDLELIECDKINWVMVFQMNSRFERFIEHLDCKKGFYLRKKFYKGKKKCVISHTYCYNQQMTEFNFFLSGVILFRTRMMNTPLLYKQYSQELNETYYILSFMFDKNKMLYSQPSEEDPDEYRAIFDDKEREKLKNQKPAPKRRTSNRGRKKRPPTLEEIEAEKERERIENDEFREFRDLIEPVESKIKFEQEQRKASQKASRSRKKKSQPTPPPTPKKRGKNAKNFKPKVEEFIYDVSDIDMDSEKSYYINYQEEDIKNSPALFILLVDQTFSMQGEGLAFLKDSLKKLLAILPKGSYYQLIGFHTFFTMYNETAVEYNQENYLSSMEQIDSMKAEGLTNILDPLSEIYYNGRYNHINLPRFIIMLTDGQIANTEECLELIEQNNSLFTLHAIGIKENFNPDFIRRAGYVGKGGYNFVKNLSNLESVLSSCAFNLMRDYLSNFFAILIDINQDVTKKIVLKNEYTHFIKQDEIFTMIFTTNDRIREEAIEIFFNYNYKNEKEDKANEDIIDKNKVKFVFCNYDFKGNNKIQENVEMSNSNVLNYFIRNLPEGTEISHLFMRNLLLNSDSCISPIYQQEYDMVLKYQILCKYSEFNLTEDFRDKEDKEDYENNKPIYKTGIVLKKNILIESFKLMDTSMDYYGLEYNYKLGLGASGKKDDENGKEDEKDAEDEGDENKQDKEWYIKKKEILAQTEEINKNVEKLNREEESDGIPQEAEELEDEEEGRSRKSKKDGKRSKSKSTKKKKKGEDDKENEDENIVNSKSKSAEKSKKSRSASKSKKDKKKDKGKKGKGKKGRSKSSKKGKKGNDLLDSDEDGYGLGGEKGDDDLLKEMKGANGDDDSGDDDEFDKPKKKGGKGKKGGKKKGKSSRSRKKEKKDAILAELGLKDDGKVLKKKRGRGGNKKGKELLIEKIQEKEDDDELDY